LEFLATKKMLLFPWEFRHYCFVISDDRSFEKTGFQPETFLRSCNLKTSHKLFIWESEKLIQKVAKKKFSYNLSKNTEQSENVKSTLLIDLVQLWSVIHLAISATIYNDKLPHVLWEECIDFPSKCSWLFVQKFLFQFIRPKCFSW
jgi:hypothetical protein